MKKITPYDVILAILFLATHFVKLNQAINTWYWYLNGQSGEESMVRYWAIH